MFSRPHRLAYDIFPVNKSPSFRKTPCHTSQASETVIRICDYCEGSIKGGAKKSKGSLLWALTPLPSTLCHSKVWSDLSFVGTEIAGHSQHLPVPGSSVFFQVSYLHLCTNDSLCLCCL